MNFSSFQMTVRAIDIKCVTTGVCCSLLARVTQSANVSAMKCQIKMKLNYTDQSRS